MASFRTSLETNESLTDHSALIGPVATYLSTSLVRCRLRNPSAPAVIGEHLEGALLFADISGFTTLSEQFAKHGKKGAEQVTLFLNEYFETMVGIATEFGGDVLQFGGDALLTVFGAMSVVGGDDEHQSTGAQPTLAESVLAATRCGLRMQNAMQQFQLLHLTMSIGVHCGKFLLASAGSYEGRLQQIVMGPTLNRLAQVEAKAEPGELLITPEAKMALGDRVVVDVVRSDCFPVVDLNDDIELCPPTANSHRDALKELARVEPATALEILQPYLIPAVYRRIAEDPAGYGNDGEHRFIATMFVRFDDMTEVMEHFGEDRPLEIIRLLDTYLAEMTQTVIRHGGSLARVSAEKQGDKLLVLFGAPVAVEHPEQRAVRCALDMNERLQEWNAKSPVALRQRIGITYGNAFCGNVGSQRRREYTVIGDEVNAAARLMAKAEPGEILTSRDVWQNARECFDFRFRGPVKVKGKEAAVEVYQLLSARERPERGPEKRHTLVGRTSECERFRHTAQEVLHGKGHLLTICGEPGVGKSALADQFAGICREFGMRGLSGHCQSYGSSIPYLPWSEILRELADIRRRDTPEVCRQKLEEQLAKADPKLAEWASLLGTVIGVNIPDNSLTASLAPRQHKEKIFAICLHVLEAWAREEPAYLVLEDIHWIDPLSQDLLAYLSSRLYEYPILILATYRPEFSVPDWGTATSVSNLALGPLANEASTQMLEGLLGTKDVPERLTELVVEKTQGNPFYVEEMIRSLREAKCLVWDEAAGRYELITDGSEVDLPGTIQGVILSRLDRLAEDDRKMLQVASVFGRDFRPDALRNVLPYELTPEKFESKLQEVVRLELVDSARSRSGPSYAFRHALVQEAAYGSLSFARRTEFHRLIGEELERVFQDEFDDHSDVLAHHFDLGQHREKAAAYLEIAGNNAKRVYANVEAADYYERALGHLRALGEEANSHRIFRVLEELGDVRSQRGEYAAAVNHYGEALVRAEAPVQRARLQGKLGGICYRQGQFEQGIEQLDVGLAHLGIRAPRTKWQVRTSILRHVLIQAAHTALPWLFVRPRSKDPEATSAAIEIYESLSRIGLSFDLDRCVDAHLRQLNLCETMPGSPEMAQTYSSHGVVCGVVPTFRRALRYQKKGLAIREKKQDRWGVGNSLGFMGVTYYCMGRWDQALSCLEEAARILEEVEDHWESHVTYLFISKTTLRKGELERTLQLARICLEKGQRTNDFQGMGWGWRQLAEVTRQQGKLDEALEYGRQALECATKARDWMWSVAIRWTLGQIYLGMGNREQAVEEMEESLQLIRDHGLRQEWVMCAYPGLAEAYLSVLDNDDDPVARRAALRRIRKLCRKAVSKAKNFPNWRCYAYRVSALYERAAGRPKNAQRFFDLSLEASAGLGARYEQAETYFAKGEFLQDLGNLAANDCLNEAARLFRECGAETLRTPVHSRVDDGDGEQAGPNRLANRITRIEQTT